MSAKPKKSSAQTDRSGAPAADSLSVRIGRVGSMWSSRVCSGIAEPERRIEKAFEAVLPNIRRIRPNYSELPNQPPLRMYRPAFSSIFVKSVKAAGVC